jgi:glycine cleavage system aminomethyltransferase T
LGHLIALALIKNGRARMGEHIVIKDHTRNIEAVCEICPLVHLDPEGEKLRA